MQNNFGTIIVVVDEDGNLKDWQMIPRDAWESVAAYYTEIAKNRSKFRDEYPEPPFRVYLGVADSLSTFLRSYPEMGRPVSKV